MVDLIKHKLHGFQIILIILFRICIDSWLIIYNKTMHTHFEYTLDVFH